MNEARLQQTLERFIADEIERVEGKFERTARIHARFLAWVERHGFTPWTRILLIRELRSHGFTDGKSNGHRGLKGLRLR